MSKLGNNPNQPEWNSSLEYLQRLERLQEQIDNTMINDDVYGRQRCIIALYTNVFMHFNQEENELLKANFLEHETDLSAYSNDHNSTLLRDINKGFMRIRMIINELLVKYNLMYQKKKQYSWQEELQDDYQ